MSPGDATEIVTLVAAGAGGLLVGSFLNVVAYRVPRHLSVVHPPSHCTACNTRLTAIDMVPVLSWVVLRAHCRHCHAPVSGRYPLVEALTAVAFVAIAATLPTHWLLPSVAVVTAGGLAAALVEADGVGVPPVIAVVMALGAVSLAPIDAALGDPTATGWAAVGAVLAGGLCLVVERMAGGARWARAAVLGSLGWTAGALWPWGGLLAAAWLAAGWPVCAEAARRTGSGRRASLPVLLAGLFAAVVASAVLARP